MNFLRKNSPTETDDGSSTMIEIVFILLLTMIIFFNVRGESAVPSGDGKGNKSVRPVPPNAVIVTLDEKGVLSVQGHQVSEATLLEAVRLEKTADQEIAFYAHPKIEHGDAHRIQLLLETTFTVLNAFIEEETKHGPQEF